MGKLVAGAVLVVIAFSLLLSAATVRSQRPGIIGPDGSLTGAIRARAHDGCSGPCATRLTDRLELFE